MKIIISFLLFSFQLAYADQVERKLEQALKKANELNKPSTCLKCLENERQQNLCSQITDSACDELWNEKNKGNMKVFDGEIFLGTSQKSSKKAAEIIDLKMLLNAEDKLPKDLKKEAGTFFRDLRKLLEKESEKSEWYNSISAMQEKWKRIIKTTEFKRINQTHPKLDAIPMKEMTFEQQSIYHNFQYKIDNQILEAKYSQSPQWKRVERLFNEVQKDVLSSIDKLKINDVEKTNLKSKIKSVKLSLPYSDPRLLGTSTNCSTKEHNAYYYPNPVNKFTICAGYFNAFQSDAALYKTIAHELGHSIDPTQLGLDNYFSNSKFYKQIKPLLENKKIDCAEWEKLKIGLSNSIFDNFDYGPGESPAEIYDKNSLFNLNECIAGNTSPSKNIDQAYTESHHYAKEHIKQLTSNNAFTRLVKKDSIVDGKAKENEYYKKPHKLYRFLKSELIDDGLENDSLNGLEIFNQNYFCELQLNPNTDTKMSFFNSIQTTQQILANELTWKTIYKGKHGKRGLNTVSTAENFADWIASRALNEKLSRVDKDKKREFIKTALYNFCSEPGPEKEEPELTLIEHYFTERPHHEDRIRRLATFNKESAESLSCQSDYETQMTFGRCEP